MGLGVSGLWRYSDLGDTHGVHDFLTRFDRPTFFSPLTVKGFFFSYDIPIFLYMSGLVFSPHILPDGAFCHEAMRISLTIHRPLPNYQLASLTVPLFWNLFSGSTDRIRSEASAQLHVLFCFSSCSGYWEEAPNYIYERI
jgi:hypothetical protein